MPCLYRLAPRVESLARFCGEIPETEGHESALLSQDVHTTPTDPLEIYGPSILEQHARYAEDPVRRFQKAVETVAFALVHAGERSRRPPAPLSGGGSDGAPGSPTRFRRAARAGGVE
jgi:hypothetical protein